MSLSEDKKFFLIKNSDISFTNAAWDNALNETSSKQKVWAVTQIIWIQKSFRRKRYL